VGPLPHEGRTYTYGWDSYRWVVAVVRGGAAQLAVAGGRKLLTKAAMQAQ